MIESVTSRPCEAARPLPRCRGIWTILALAAALAGCAAASPANPPISPEADAPPPDRAGAALRLSFEPVGAMPNSGLQLPTLSPDGEWSAFLAVEPGAAVGPTALFSGDGLHAVALVVAPTQQLGLGEVVLRGACWPTWSSDSQQLAAVAYPAEGPAVLALHDVRTGKTEQIATGFARLAMPALSPGSRHAAVAAYDTDPAHSRLHVIDLTAADRPAVPGPPAAAGVAQFAPSWVDEVTLAYLAVSSAGVELRTWTLGAAASQRVGRLGIVPASAMGVYQALAGIADPVSPDGQWFACYASARRRIVLTHLVSGQRRELGEGTQAGCWLPGEAGGFPGVLPGILPEAGAFAAASGEELRLYPMDGAISRLLLDGQTLPRRGDALAGTLTILTPSSQPQTLELIRLHLEAAAPAE